MIGCLGNNKYIMNILEVFEYNQHFVAMMNIINNARLNPPIEGHKHHIIPRCWFKMNGQEVDNSNDNLVLLTYEDHIKVHKLAYLCSIRHELKSKMAFAVNRMINYTGEGFKGYKHTKESKLKMSKSKKSKHIIPWNKGKTMSEEYCQRNREGQLKVNRTGINNPFFGKHHTEEFRNTLSNFMKGNKHTKEHNERISEGLKLFHLRNNNNE